ncbi:hypothetical protein LX36DRAFT_393616 [Colletotrichum falcatum]|nr:hypothetical protein LX36DRAFT_393616 [Colletotrichum falcatum]
MPFIDYLPSLHVSLTTLLQLQLPTLQWLLYLITRYTQNKSKVVVPLYCLTYLCGERQADHAATPIKAPANHTPLQRKMRIGSSVFLCWSPNPGNLFLKFSSCRRA